MCLSLVYLLSICHVPGPVQCAGETVVSKQADMAPLELPVQRKRQVKTQTTSEVCDYVVNKGTELGETHQQKENALYRCSGHISQAKTCRMRPVL